MDYVIGYSKKMQSYESKNNYHVGRLHQKTRKTIVAKLSSMLVDFVNRRKEAVKNAALHRKKAAEDSAQRRIDAMAEYVRQRNERDRVEADLDRRCETAKIFEFERDRIDAHRACHAVDQAMRKTPNEHRQCPQHRFQNNWRVGKMDRQILKKASLCRPTSRPIRVHPSIKSH